MDTYVARHEIIYHDKDFGQTKIPPGKTLTDAQVKALGNDLKSLEKARAVSRVTEAQEKAERQVKGAALDSETK